ncbi:MAG: tripartite tricarboxylate transporter substrate binding protein [Candidatus Heteroscillospira sp.]|jgi:tripartite-type tricarboxylate transporter receptor subunit TctC
MKKTLAAVLAALMLVGLMAGCGGGNTTPESTAPESTAPESTAPESSAEPEAWKPTQSVELVIPYSAGGSSDLLGRAVESVWSKYCDQPLVVTNMPGGGGVTGSMYVSGSKPDGYTIGLAYGSGCDMSMPYLQEMDYDPFEALDPICCLSVHTVMIATQGDSEFNTLADVVQWSKDSGKPITASVSTANGTVDLTFQALKNSTGVDMNIVPHDGTAGAITDLLSGTYVIGGGHPSDVLSYVQSGQLKLLGVATDERDSAMPDVPTLKEQGIDFAAYGSIKGVSVPKNMPQEIKDYYEELFANIAADEDFIAAMNNMGQPVMYMDTEEFTQYFADANAFYKQLIEDLGLAYYNK